jgi:hypothetical protein
MIINGNCEECGAELSGDATPMPLENTGGREGFFEYDFDCPKCGHNMEGVLKEVKKA